MKVDSSTLKNLWDAFDNKVLGGLISGATMSDEEIEKNTTRLIELTEKALKSQSK